jgi:hypothetical protein
VFHTRLARSTLLLAALAVVACDDDDDITDPPGTLALSVSRTTLDVAAGSSDTLTASITRGGSFTGTVNLTVEDAPEGVTATLATPSLTGTQTSSAVTITVVAAVAPGSYPLTVKAEGDGVTDQETTVTLNVIAPVVVSFSLAATPDTAEITQGDTASALVTLTRTGGFGDAVVITTDSLPDGVTAVIGAPSLTGDTTTVTLTASDSATAGSYRFFITGTADTIVRTDTVALNVVAATAAGFSLAGTPDTARVTQGATANTLVTLTRTGGFADTVVITTDSLPAGVTAVIGAPSLGGDTTTVTLTASATATPGTFRFFITGTSGSIVSTDTIPVVVSASSIIGAMRTTAPQRRMAAARTSAARANSDGRTPLEPRRGDAFLDLFE